MPPTALVLRYKPTGGRFPEEGKKNGFTPPCNYLWNQGQVLDNDPKAVLSTVVNKALLLPGWWAAARI
jgi:hypothetical protein